MKGTEEILGGYNPTMWKSSSKWIKTKDSFIFSFKSKNNFKDSILSRVNNLDKAFYCSLFRGPSFGDYDIFLHNIDFSENYNRSYCKFTDYEKKIRDTEEFLIEDYEVFQILKFKN